MLPNVLYSLHHTFRSQTSHSYSTLFVSLVGYLQSWNSHKMAVDEMKRFAYIEILYRLEMLTESSIP